MSIVESVDKEIDRHIQLANRAEERILFLLNHRKCEKVETQKMKSMRFSKMYFTLRDLFYSRAFLSQATPYNKDSKVLANNQDSLFSCIVFHSAALLSSSLAKQRLGQLLSHFHTSGTEQYATSSMKII
jgi:hypothetical protein